jgi:hypothetical protein
MLEALVQNDSDINLQHILGRMRVTSHATVSTLRESGQITYTTDTARQCCTP